jgi:tRNA modification GTPase
MLASQNAPIVAIATAPGRGAVGMVRVSGPKLAALIQALCQRDLVPRVATYLPFLDAAGDAIDHGIALYFPAPNSFTGEDVLELQAHGGSVVLKLLQERCLQAAQELLPGSDQPRLAGLRLAQAGEFTRRAFLNDKLDLVQAEAVSDLIDASTETAAKSAMRSLSGAFSQEINQLRDALIHLRTLVEAALDFPEEDIDFLQQADAHGQLEKLLKKTQQTLAQTEQGALLREGIRVVIAGQPNAGKSSLLNALAGDDVAIVTAVAGTTRDKIEQTLQIEGVPIHVIDTAGLRASQDEVERLGIARTWQAIKDADVILFLHDLERSSDAAYQAADRQIAAEMAQGLASNTPILDLWNKCDVAGTAAHKTGLCVSAKKGDGLDNLKRTLLELSGWRFDTASVFTARTRHVKAIENARKHILFAQQCLTAASPVLDLMAEELRLAQNALNEITGEFNSDDLLGEIFSKFCIGK